MTDTLLSSFIDHFDNSRCSSSDALSETHTLETESRLLKKKKHKEVGLKYYALYVDFSMIKGVTKCAFMNEVIQVAYSKKYRFVGKVENMNFDYLILFPNVAVFTFTDDVFVTYNKERISISDAVEGKYDDGDASLENKESTFINKKLEETVYGTVRMVSSLINQVAILSGDVNRLTSILERYKEDGI